MLLINAKQAGFSLIELMISMAVGIMLTSGAIGIFTGSMKNNYEFVSRAKLDQDLQGVLNLIAKETRRAGYDANIPIGSSSDFGIDANSTSTCLLYSYDSNTSGTLGQVDSAEQYGIRFNSSTNKILFGSKVTACSGTGWSAINDANTVQITSLSFTQNNICLNLNDDTDCTTVAAASGDNLLWKKQVNIVIAGNYKNDTNNYVHTVQSTVRLHNDILLVAP